MSELSIQDLQAILADREARIKELVSALVKSERDLEAARAGEASLKADITRMAKEMSRLKGVLAGMGLE